MNIAHQIEDLATDAQPPRLLGSDRQSPEAKRARKRSAKMLRAATEAAQSVETEAAYQAWYAQHGEPLLVASGETRLVLGGCMGDEGSDICAVVDLLFRATHQPGWRCEP